MYKDIFTQLGLSPNEATVYECLLKNGQSTVGEIIKKTPLKRGVAYNILSDLVKKDLVSEKKIKIGKGKEKVAHFVPNHPEKLRDYLENKKSQFDKIENTLNANLPSLVSDFNLISGKPGVRFFEGIEGVKKVLEDTLTSKETIYAYSDIEAMVKFIDKINKEYVKKREELRIKKKAILIDAPFTRDYLKNYHLAITENKFIDHKLFSFNSLMQIYDNKIAYVTLSDKSKIGVIIEDKNIYQMHKSLFEFTWTHAKTFDQLSPFSKAQ